MGKGTHQKGLSRKWMLEAIDQSLERLKTNYLDIWYLHLPDPQTPIEETLETISQVLHQLLPPAGRAQQADIAEPAIAQVAEAIRPHPRDAPPSRLLCAEQPANLAGGAVWPLKTLQAVALISTEQHAAARAALERNANDPVVGSACREALQG